MKKFGAAFIAALSALLILLAFASCETPVEPEPEEEYLDMVSVPAGRFQRDATETNICEVSAFRISKYEITRAQFLEIMGTDPTDLDHTSGTSDPVQMVNWYHAIAFCNKLSLHEGLTPVYAVTGVNFSTLIFDDIPVDSDAAWNAATCDWDANGYRLPTEMEWWWAAMGAPADGQGGGTNTDGYTKAFAGSTGTNTLGDYAWYDGNALNSTHPVTTKLPNEIGLYHMSGNVWEYVWDWYGALDAGTLTDYRGAGTGTTRSLIGGSWQDLSEDCEMLARWDFNPSGQFECFGFRVARNP